MRCLLIMNSFRKLTMNQLHAYCAHASVHNHTHTHTHARQMAIAVTFACKGTVALTCFALHAPCRRDCLDTTLRPGFTHSLRGLNCTQSQLQQEHQIKSKQNTSTTAVNHSPSTNQARSTERGRPITIEAAFSHHICRALTSEHHNTQPQDQKNSTVNQNGTKTSSTNRTWKSNPHGRCLPPSLNVTSTYNSLIYSKTVPISTHTITSNLNTNS